MDEQDGGANMADDDGADGWYGSDIATFGDRVAGAREASGMSAGDLAQRLGVGIKTLESWEDDLAEPRANKLQMLSGLLNVSLRWLLTGEGEGLAGPRAEADLPEDLRGILNELRTVKAEMSQTAERLGRLEKRLVALVAGT